MKKNISIKKTKTYTEINFEKFPLWKGIKTYSGDQEFYPFKIRAEINNHITQKNSDKILQLILGNYNKSSYSFITYPPGSGSWANESALKKISIFDRINTNFKSKSFLEIGAGTNWVAKEIIKKYDPISYTCVDPTITDNDENIEIIRDYYPSKKIYNKQYDVIIGINVLEHVLNPYEFLESIKNNLTSKGYAVLYFPDCENQLKIGDINSLLHEHISYFTEKSLRSLLSKVGLKIISINSKNDLFTLILQREKDRLDKEINFDERNLLDEYYNSFNFLLGEFTENIKSMIKKGKKVAFHGATQGLNSYIFLAHLQDYDFYIFDSDINKKGKYLPSYKKAIKHSSNNEYQNMDLIIISAVSFYELIKKQIQQKKLISDHLIIPFYSM